MTPWPGIMARLNYLLMELDNPKSTIYFATEAVVRLIHPLSQSL